MAAAALLPKVGIPPAGQQILYGLIVLVMLFVYGRGARGAGAEVATGRQSAPGQGRGRRGGWRRNPRR